MHSCKCFLQCALLRRIWAHTVKTVQSRTPTALHKCNLAFKSATKTSTQFCGKNYHKSPGLPTRKEIPHQSQTVVSVSFSTANNFRNCRSCLYSFQFNAWLVHFDWMHFISFHCFCFCVKHEYEPHWPAGSPVSTNSHRQLRTSF